MAETMAAKTALEDGFVSVGVVAAGDESVAVGFTPAEEFTGTDGATRILSVIELTHDLQFVQVVGELLLDASVTAPDDEDTAIPVDAGLQRALTPGNYVAVLSQHVGAGLAVPALTFTATFS